MKEGLSKKESAFLKGLALIMMIYHHRFIDTTVWTADPAFASQFHFLLDEEVTRVISWFFKIALSLMTFVSGYGIYHVLHRNNEKTFLRKLGNGYKQVGKRLIPFYGRYWYAFIVWTIVEVILNQLPIFNLEYLLNGLGLSCSLNGSWWYVLQYVEMMALAPLLDLYLTKFSLKVDIIKWSVPVVLGGVIFLVPPLRSGFMAFYEISAFQISYMAIFIVGFIIAKWNLFGKLRTLLSKLPLALHLIICFVGLAGIILIRVRLSTFPAYCRTDFIIAPIFILFLCELLSYIPCVLSFFGWFSKYSMYIWVLHLIFFDPFFYPITMWSGLAIVDYLMIVLLTVGASLLLSLGEKGYYKLKARIRSKEA